MTIIIAAHESCDYLEVWRVVERRDGLVYKTASTDKFIHRSDAGKLSVEYVTSGLSTRLTRRVEIQLDMFDVC